MSRPEPATRPPHLTCPDCRRTTFNPQDVATGYCGACHWWTSDPVLGPSRRTASGPTRRRTSVRLF